tara:strand:+ start:1690 stop:3090 length:1401 start_codon:yes stop_codon:yes gene_type:complete
MATRLITKNNSTAGAVPSASDLHKGELAVNLADKRLHTETAAGSIIELGINPTSLTTGAITASGGLTAAGSISGAGITASAGITATGAIAGASLTASGTVTGATLTDGTASLASGSWTSLVGVTASGTIQFGNLSDGSISIASFLNSNTMSGASASNVPTALSVKNYVDSVATSHDLDFQGDAGGQQSVDLDSQVLDIAGGTNVGTSSSGQQLTINLDAALTGLTSAAFSGGVTAGSFTGSLTGNVAGNITGSGSSSLTTLATTNLTAGGVAFPTSDGTSAQVISTNGSGVASWTTIPSLDANLQAFAAQFTLPTADGDDGQVLSQTSSGNIGFKTISGGGRTDIVQVSSSGADYVVENAYEIMPSNVTITGTFQVFSGSNVLEVVEPTTIGAIDDYLVTNETLSSSRIFYKIGYIADAATITVNSGVIMQGVGATPVAGSESSGGGGTVDTFRTYGELMYFGQAS